jgi:hypothetical protein
MIILFTKFARRLLLILSQNSASVDAGMSRVSGSSVAGFTIDRHDDHTRIPL